jgi:hypothetical protein
MFDDRYIGQDDEPDQSQERDGQICPDCGKKVDWPEVGYHDGCIERRRELENT